MLYDRVSSNIRKSWVLIVVFIALVAAMGWAFGYLTGYGAWAVPIAVGQRYVVRSRITCQIGVPKYAKMEILQFNDVTRIVTFRILVNDNCGFRSLEPGLPDR